MFLLEPGGNSRRISACIGLTQPTLPCVTRSPDLRFAAGIHSVGWSRTAGDGAIAMDRPAPRTFQLCVVAQHLLRTSTVILCNGRPIYLKWKKKQALCRKYWAAGTHHRSTEPKSYILKSSLTSVSQKICLWSPTKAKTCKKGGKSENSATKSAGSARVACVACQPTQGVLTEETSALPALDPRQGPGSQGHPAAIQAERRLAD